MKPMFVSGVAPSDMGQTKPFGFASRETEAYLIRLTGRPRLVREYLKHARAWTRLAVKKKDLTSAQAVRFINLSQALRELELVLNISEYQREDLRTSSTKIGPRTRD